MDNTTLSNHAELVQAGYSTKWLGLWPLKPDLREHNLLDLYSVRRESKIYKKKMHSRLTYRMTTYVHILNPDYVSNPLPAKS